MKRTETLPENYELIHTIDLEKNKSLFIFIQVFSLLLAVGTFCVGLTMQSITYVLDFGPIQWLICAGLSILYLIAHEMVHGVAMKIVGTKKVKYGFVGTYAYAGGDDYYARGPYIFIALAPVVLYAVIFTILGFVVPAQWFWIVWLLQITNIAGAAGDIYVTWKCLRLPKDILIKDAGTSMQIFAPSSK